MAERAGQTAPAVAGVHSHRFEFRHPGRSVQPCEAGCREGSVGRDCHQIQLRFVQPRRAAPRVDLGRERALRLLIQRGPVIGMEREIRRTPGRPMGLDPALVFGRCDGAKHVRPGIWRDRPGVQPHPMAHRWAGLEAAPGGRPLQSQVLVVDHDAQLWPVGSLGQPVEQSPGRVVSLRSHLDRKLARWAECPPAHQSLGVPNGRDLTSELPRREEPSQSAGMHSEGPNPALQLLHGPPVRFDECSEFHHPNLGRALCD